MRVHSAEFVKSATRPEEFPPPDHPEVAFAGRSNVGKSSLINVLVNRKKLVRVSKTPGHTKFLKFFEVGEGLFLVDVAGYGFGDGPDDVKDSWGPMIEGYLANRPNLMAIVVIMDLRRGLEEDDLELIEAAPHFGVQPIMVFTKADKLGKQARRQKQFDIANQFGVHADEIILFSSLEKFGIDEVWDRIETITGLK